MSDTLQEKLEVNLNHYNKDGYLIVRDFLSKAECKALLNRTNQLIDQFKVDESKVMFDCENQDHVATDYFLDSHDKIHLFFEPDAFDQHGKLAHDIKLSVNKIGHGLHMKDDVFKKLSHHPHLVQLCEELNIPHARIVQSMVICKHAFVGGEVNCHQDETFLNTKNGTLTGLWFALEDATVENACLWAIPGGHKEPLKKQLFYRDGKMEMVEYNSDAWNMEKMVPLEVPAGSLIILHGLLPHMSKTNYSDKSRHAFTFHVMANDDEVNDGNWIKHNPHFPEIKGA